MKTGIKSGCWVTNPNTYLWYSKVVALHTGLALNYEKTSSQTGCQWVSSSIPKFSPLHNTASNNHKFWYQHVENVIIYMFLEFGNSAAVENRASGGEKRTFSMVLPLADIPQVDVVGSNVMSSCNSPINNMIL